MIINSQILDVVEGKYIFLYSCSEAGDGTHSGKLICRSVELDDININNYVLVK